MSLGFERLSVGTILVAGQVITDYELYISEVCTVIRLRAGHPSNRGLTPGGCKIFSVFQRIHSGSRAHPASYSTGTLCSIAVSTTTGS